MNIRGSKYLWKITDPDMAAVTQIAATHNMSVPLANVLYSRGFTAGESINSFLFSTYEKDVAPATLLKSSDVAVDRIVRAIEKKEKILIFGDYDVDGITSVSLMLVALLPLGANINFYLPNRERDGYGLSEKAVKKAATAGYSLIITVDNGITAYAAAKKAQELGIDLIITDHHLPHDQLPPALAIVDPNQKGCVFPHKNLAGVGVIFKVISLVYERKNLTLPDKVYELLMLGTVADVVPLVNENRFWVRHGLATVNKQRSIALAVLAQNNKLVKSRLGSLDIGFSIAPQINALGRLDDPREAVKFLISSDKRDVEKIGRLLGRMNEERKKVERGIYEEIEMAIVNKQIDVEKENCIIAASDKWPAGVIGLVAGRLVQNYGKPTLLFHALKDGTVRGSCRSIPEFNIFNALEANKDFLLSFGGHAHAAGVSLKKKDVPAFKEKLEAYIAARVSAEDLQPKIECDAFCQLPEVNTKLLSDLEQLEPFGNANKQPTFVIKEVTLLRAPQLLKDKHVKCTIFSEGTIKPVIFFNRPDLYSICNQMGDKSFSIAGHVIKNEWNNRINIELQGLDIAF